MNDSNPWTTTRSRLVYENAWIRVREDDVLQPDGKPGIYGVVEFRNRAVGIVAHEEDSIYLVGQFRYPTNSYSWEIPEGGCPFSEAPLAAAKRELREETGILADNWELMGQAHLSNSVSNELAIWFLATGLSFGPCEPEVTECLEIRRVSVTKAMEMIQKGEITDSISIMAIMQFALMKREAIQSGRKNKWINPA